MNGNPKQIRPPIRSPRPHHPHHMNNNNVRPPHPHGNYVRARPPSYSRAPWDVTKWVDPIQSYNPRLQK